MSTRIQSENITFEWKKAGKTRNLIEAPRIGELLLRVDEITRCRWTDLLQLKQHCASIIIENN